jgi:hypothetical protein
VSKPDTNQNPTGTRTVWDSHACDAWLTMPTEADSGRLRTARAHAGGRPLNATARSTADAPSGTSTGRPKIPLRRSRSSAWYIIDSEARQVWIADGSGWYGWSIARRTLGRAMATLLPWHPG